MEKISQVDLAFANEAMERLSKVAEEVKDLSPAPLYMKLISHQDVKSIVWLFGVQKGLSEQFIEKFTLFTESLCDIKKILKSGGTRDAVLKRLEQCLVDVGFDSNQLEKACEKKV